MAKGNWDKISNEIKKDLKRINVDTFKFLNSETAILSGDIVKSFYNRKDDKGQIGLRRRSGQDAQDRDWEKT